MYAWKPLEISHHLATFNGQRPYGDRDITYLFCHVTLQNHVIKESCDLMEGSSLLYIPTLQSSVAIDIVEVDIK